VVIRNFSTVTVMIFSTFSMLQTFPKNIVVRVARTLT
jgi:hypothetical protein